MNAFQDAYRPLIDRVGREGYLPLGCTCPWGVPALGVYLPGGTCPGTPHLLTEFLTHATENIVKIGPGVGRTFAPRVQTFKKFYSNTKSI